MLCRDPGSCHAHAHHSFSTDTVLCPRTCSVQETRQTLLLCGCGSWFCGWAKATFVMRCPRRMAVLVAWAAWASARATELRVALAANSNSDAEEGCLPLVPEVVPGPTFACLPFSEGSMDLAGAEMSLSAKHLTAAVYALRFPARIPRRARIVAANVTFAVKLGGGAELQRSIVGLVDAGPFSDNRKGDLTKRRATAATVVWTGAPPQPNTVPGTKLVTPDLATIVQELVNSDAWDDGEQGALLLLFPLPPAAQPQLRANSAAPLLFRATKKGAQGATAAGLARDSVVPVLHVSYHDDASAPENLTMPPEMDSAVGTALALGLVAALVAALVVVVYRRRQQQQQQQQQQQKQQQVGGRDSKVSALGEQAKGHQDAASATATTAITDAATAAASGDAAEKRARAALAAAKTSATALAAATGRALRPGRLTAKARAALQMLGQRKEQGQEQGRVQDRADDDDDEIIVISSVKNVQHMATGGLEKDLKPMQPAAAADIENLV
jgi:hypothetical protein